MPQDNTVLRTQKGPHLVNYRLIMSLLLEGTSYRDIQSRCGAAHAATAKARKALNEHAITTHAQLEGYSDDELTSLIWRRSRQH